jgi:hypothetical protein
MEIIDEFNRLIVEYMALHPNSKNPTQYLFNVDMEIMIEMLKNANGRKIIYVYDDDSVDDGGLIKYE